MAEIVHIHDLVVREGLPTLYKVIAVSIIPSFPAHSIAYLLRVGTGDAPGEWTFISNLIIEKPAPLIIEAPEIEQEYLVYRE